MLIWKIIAANPEITREEIWKRIEHDIPAGYAKRRYVRYRETAGGGNSRLAGESKSLLVMARRYVLRTALKQMRAYGNVTCSDGDPDERRYTVAREPRYRGNAGAIDETGTKAAEHMAVADALRTAEKMLARAKPGGHGPAVCANRKEYEALVLVVKALRAKGST